MKKELNILNEEESQAFTSDYLRQRKTCCRSGCLHCPYGYTIKKFGLKFIDFTGSDLESLKSILVLANEDFDFSQYQSNDIKFVTLKDHICGVLFKNHIVIKKLVLIPQFNSQGISRELVESYFFV